MRANMSKFTETVNQDTPRLVVMFRRAENGQEQFQWGVVGKIPILTLLGLIVRVQAELTFKHAEECPESALVIAWDDGLRKAEWFVHPDIPVDPLVGMLETIKVTILGTHMARQVAAQQVILGPDGQPIRRAR